MRYGMRWRKVRKDKETAAAKRKEEKKEKDIQP
jgi:hypothetical protein